MKNSGLINISTLSELCRREERFGVLLQQWHPLRNRSLPPYGVTLTPDSVTPTDSRLVWWQCRRGHSWCAAVASRVNAILEGSDAGCPFCKPERISRCAILWDYCQGPVPEGEVDCRHLLAEWDYEKNYPLTPRDVKTVEYRKVWWKCARGHSWQALISNRVKAGVGCPYCGHRRVLPGFNDLATLYPALAKEWDPAKNPLPAHRVSAYANRKAWWRCEEGHSYEKTVSNRTQHGQGCPICRALRNEKGSMLLPGVNDLATTHPHLAAQWDEANDLAPSQVKAGSRRLVWWRCEVGHRWQTPVSRRTGKRPVGCPVCSAKRHP